MAKAKAADRCRVVAGAAMFGLILASEALASATGSSKRVHDGGSWSTNGMSSKLRAGNGQTLFRPSLPSK